MNLSHIVAMFLFCACVSCSFDLRADETVEDIPRIDSQAANAGNLAAARFAKTISQNGALSDQAIARLAEDLVSDLAGRKVLKQLGFANADWSKMSAERFASSESLVLVLSGSPRENFCAIRVVVCDSEFSELKRAQESASAGKYDCVFSPCASTEMKDDSTWGFAYRIPSTHAGASKEKDGFEVCCYAPGLIIRFLMFHFEEGLRPEKLQQVLDQLILRVNERRANVLRPFVASGLLTSEVLG